MNPKSSPFIIISTLALIILSAYVPKGQSRLVTVRKCCPANQVIDVNKMKCRDSGAAKWSPRYYPDSEAGANQGAEEETNYEIVTKIPKCPRGRGVHIIPLKGFTRLSVPIPAAKFRLLKSGRLVGKHVNGQWIDVPLNSCIDGIMNFLEPNDSSVFTGEEIDQAIITCPVESS